jgi:hypothetical protein
MIADTRQRVAGDQTQTRRTKDIVDLDQYGIIARAQRYRCRNGIRRFGRAIPRTHFLAVEPDLGAIGCTQIQRAFLVSFRLDIGKCIGRRTRRHIVVGQRHKTLRADGLSLDYRIYRTTNNRGNRYPLNSRRFVYVRNGIGTIDQPPAIAQPQKSGFGVFLKLRWISAIASPFISIWFISNYTAPL